MVPSALMPAVSTVALIPSDGIRSRAGTSAAGVEVPVKREGLLSAAAGANAKKAASGPRLLIRRAVKSAAPAKTHSSPIATVASRA